MTYNIPKDIPKDTFIHRLFNSDLYIFIASVISLIFAIWLIRGSDLNLVLIGKCLIVLYSLLLTLIIVKYVFRVGLYLYMKILKKYRI